MVSFLYYGSTFEQIQILTLSCRITGKISFRRLRVRKYFVNRVKKK